MKMVDEYGSLRNLSQLNAGALSTYKISCGLLVCQESSLGVPKFGYNDCFKDSAGCLRATPR